MGFLGSIFGNKSQIESLKKRNRAVSKKYQKGAAGY